MIISIWKVSLRGWCITWYFSTQLETRTSGLRKIHLDHLHFIDFKLIVVYLKTHLQNEVRKVIWMETTEFVEWCLYVVSVILVVKWSIIFILQNLINEKLTYIELSELYKFENHIECVKRLDMKAWETKLSVASKSVTSSVSLKRLHVGLCRRLYNLTMLNILCCIIRCY